MSPTCVGPARGWFFGGALLLAVACGGGEEVPDFSSGGTGGTNTYATGGWGLMVGGWSTGGVYPVGGWSTAGWTTTTGGWTLLGGSAGMPWGGTTWGGTTWGGDPGSGGTLAGGFGGSTMTGGFGGTITGGGTLTGGTSTGGTDPGPGCPSFAPLLGGACKPDAAVCTYPAEKTCTSGTTVQFVCAASTWFASRASACPPDLVAVSARPCPVAAPYLLEPCELRGLECAYADCCGDQGQRITRCELDGWIIDEARSTRCGTCPAKAPREGEPCRPFECPATTGDRGECAYAATCGGLDVAACIDGKWVLDLACP